MDEKELIRRTKNSIKAGKSNSEILSGFQKRGYKLAYADEILKRAKRPKRIGMVLVISFLLFFSLTFSAYNIFSVKSKDAINNPLTGYSVSRNNLVISNTSTSNITESSEAENEGSSNEIAVEDIEIDENFISYILNEIDAWKLHKSPFTFEDPIINIEVDDKKFYSKLGGSIETYSGLSQNADLVFYVNEDDLIDSILSENPKDVFSDSVKSGRSNVKLLASEVELFSKGYTELYDSLKS